MPSAVYNPVALHQKVNLFLYHFTWSALQFTLTSGREQRCHFATSEQRPLSSWGGVLPSEAAQAGLLDDERTRGTEMKHPVKAPDMQDC